MLSTRHARLAVSLTLLLCALPLAAEEWSRFRGPNGSGLSDSTGLPVEVGPETNVAWATAVPFGRSSPAITSDRIFLTATDGGKLITLAVARGTGKVLWQRELERSHDAGLYKDTDSATPSPVTDGKNVFAFFHEAGLVSYDADGKERWRMALGPFRNYYGVGSSPVLAGELLYLLCDQAEGSFLLAVDKSSGKERWRRNRPARLESYSTPILYPSAAQPKAILISGSRWVDAYDLATGKSVWALGGVGSGPVSSPVLDGDLMFINAHDHADGGWPPFDGLLEEHDKDKNARLTKAEVEGSWLLNHFGWLDADASGEITAKDWTHMAKELVNDGWGVHAIRVPSSGAPADGKVKPEIVWSYQKNVPYIPSPLVYDGVFYMVKDDVVTSLDAATGQLLKRGRLGSGKGKVYASPVIAGGKIYVGTLDGKLVVLEAGRRASGATPASDWAVAQTNDLGDEIWASPAIAGEHLYVRTRGKLYDFVATPEPAEGGEPVEAPSASGR